MKEVKNPHIHSFVSVIRVETSKDLHHAKVYVSMIGTDSEKAHMLEALQSAAGFIAVNASKQVELRYFPDLIFKLDLSLENQLKINDILVKLEQERLSRS